MKLHLGCGSVIKSGFLNIDVLDICHTEYIKHDLTSGLPASILEGSVDLIYSSHFLEHLTNKQAHNLLQECYRVMSPGGLIKLCLPDITACIKEWINGNTTYFNNISRSSFGIPANLYSWISYLEYATHQHGEHLTLWDQDKSFTYLSDVGFINPSMRSPESIDGADPARLAYSFFVQAQK